ncbi:hypothetical protein B0H14DRAFT_2788218 [Mycena olivaceomarginata]|nr:hypothetical protein B0H14DRAFT_2788218 [Mycena olivaceomarginata]
MVEAPSRSSVSTHATTTPTHSRTHARTHTPMERTPHTRTGLETEREQIRLFFKCGRTLAGFLSFFFVSPSRPFPSSPPSILIHLAASFIYYIHAYPIFPFDLFYILLYLTPTPRGAHL